MALKPNEEIHLIKCYDLADSFLRVAENLQNEFQKKQISLDLAGGILCFLLAKNLTTAEAVLVLCRKGYTKDALVLVRSIYEAALWALDIFREHDIVSEKAIAFIKDEPIDRKEMLKKMLTLVQQNESKKVNGDDSFTLKEESESSSAFMNKEKKLKMKIIEELTKAEEEISKIEKEYKVRKSLENYGKKKVLQLATDAQLLHVHHSFYWQSSLYAHNRPRSSISFMEETEKGWRFSWGPEGKHIDDVLIYLCHFLWYIINQFNSHFKLEQDNLILRKWQELEGVISAASKEE